MTELSWEAVKAFVHERAGGCCEYCHTCETNTGQAMHIEHIDPNGGDLLNNLCLACPNCNLSKATATMAVDPMDGATVALYNPRAEDWSVHFRWSDDFTEVQGATPTGRATVDRLKMNRLRIVMARERWVQAGFHPPNEASDAADNY